MSERQRVLAALRRRPPAASALPHSSGPWQRFADPTARFAATLESVGGSCRRVRDRTALAAALESLPAWREARRVLSLVSGVRGRGPNGADSDLDCALLPGRFAVAENAAVWVEGDDVPDRALFFLPQHVALAVAAVDVVHNMHEAYERLSFAGGGFGCFISGPSKTADIEQALVIGAHGPRSLTVFLVAADG